MKKNWNTNFCLLRTRRFPLFCSMRRPQKNHNMLLLCSISLVDTLSFLLTSTSFSLCSREAASSSFFSSSACPSSAARIRSASIAPPLSTLPEEDEDDASPKERAIEEEEERGKKESSRLGEGKLFFLVVNISDTCRNQSERRPPQAGSGLLYDYNYWCAGLDRFMFPTKNLAEVPKVVFPEALGQICKEEQTVMTHMWLLNPFPRHR